MNSGLSRAAIYRAVEASLRRLQTDYIDVLQIHRFDNTVPAEETMSALHDLVKSGRVRYLGASSMWTYQFASLQWVAEKNGWTKFCSMQNHYNLIYREEEREMNKFCTETGVGLMPVRASLPLSIKPLSALSSLYLTHFLIESNHSGLPSHMEGWLVTHIKRLSQSGRRQARMELSMKQTNAARTTSSPELLKSLISVVGQ